MKCFWLILTVVVTVGCSAQRPKEPYYTRLYEGTYDDLWGASIAAMRDYPLRFSNKDTGKIQTEIVNGPYNDLVFTYPDPIETPDRFRFSVKAQVAKVGSSKKGDIIRVRLSKDLERHVDFYTGWLPVSPDGIEERIILYRIAQTQEIQRALTIRK